MPPVVRAAIARTYDVGAIIRGVIQVIAIILVGSYAWFTLDSRAQGNREWLIRIQAQLDNQGTVLQSIPLLSLTANNLQQTVDKMDGRLAEQTTLRETLAGVSAQLKSLADQVSRLEGVIYRDRAARGPQR